MPVSEPTDSTLSASEKTPAQSSTKSSARFSEGAFLADEVSIAGDGVGTTREPGAEPAATTPPIPVQPAKQVLASVIVPVYNGARVIERCLDALADQTVDPGQWEIIVVADGSTDETPDVVEGWIARRPKVKAQLVVQHNAGPAAARNRGAELAQGPLLLFTDADCAPEPDWIERLLAAFEETDVSGAKGVYLTQQTALVARFVQAEYEDRYDRMADLEQIDAIDTYAAGYRRDVFLENGGFDTAFVRAACEDHDLSFRLAHRGYRLIFVPDVKVQHLHVESVGGYMRRKYHVGFWKSLLTRRHPQRIVYDTHTPQTLKLQILLSGLVVGLLPLGLGALIWPVLGFVWWLIGVALLVFYLSAGSFLAKLWARAPRLAAIGLLLLPARALASGVGYLMGTIHFARRPV